MRAFARYFDYNATTPMWPEARESWLDAESKFWYNASSLYREGAAARHFLEAQREELAEMLEIVPERLLFTAGATEGNNSVFWDAFQRGVNTAAISELEHPSVQEGARLRELEIRKISAQEIRDFKFLEDLKAQGVGLVSVMAANNESGLLLPWRELASAAQREGILFHSDVVQWMGKRTELSLGEVDYATASAHKFGGPKGAGFLVIPQDERLFSYLKGGAQEERRRAGTENVAAIAAMVVALKRSLAALEEAPEKAGMRDRFEKQLQDAMPEIQVLHQTEPRLWNTSQLVMPRHDQRKWVARLSQLGFGLSTGSACSAGSEGASRVAESMALDREARRRVLRVSAGWETQEADWAELFSAMKEVLESLDRPKMRRADLRD